MEREGLSLGPCSEVEVVLVHAAIVAATPAATKARTKFECEDVNVNVVSLIELMVCHCCMTAVSMLYWAH